MNLKLSLCFLLTGALAFAQIPQATKKSTSSLSVHEKLSQKKYDMRLHNRPKQIQNLFETDKEVYQNHSSRRNSEIEPFADITVEKWGVISDMQTGAEIFMSSGVTGNQLTVKTYDNDLQETLSFSLDVPETANQVDVLNHHSVNFFSNDGQEEFMIFLHYFDPQIPGPAGQISAVWVVNGEGEVLKEFDAITADAKIDADGNKRVLLYNEEDYDTVIISSYNVEDWSLINEYSFEWDLINFFAGAPFHFATIDGVEYAYVAHYKHELLDQMTYEVYPDNNLIIKVMDLDLEEVKTVMLDIDSRFDDEGIIIPMANFGNFYRNQTYDISKHIFNGDDKLEFVYGIQYYDLMGDMEWFTFLVGNEDGDVLHELNEYIFDVFTDMNEISGHDNQLGLLMGEEGEATTLSFFDIESWQIVSSFNAMMGDDLISAYFNRIPRGDSYNYLIGLGEPDDVDGQSYGVVNEYKQDGTVENRHRFLLPEGYEFFQPILSSYALIPGLFGDDNELYFFNLIKQRGNGGGAIMNNLSVVREGGEVIHEFRGDTEKGDIIASSFLTNGAGVFDKITISYDSSSLEYMTEFYRLPLVSSLNVEDIIETSKFVLYPNPVDNILNISASGNLKAIQVYTMSGKLLVSKELSSVQEELNLSSLASGIYIVNVVLENGTTKNMKLIKK